MDKREISGSSYNKLVSPEDTPEDEHSLSSNQERQVRLSTVRPESTSNLYNLLTVSLTVLAVILLSVNIGLGVYYSRLATNTIVRDISSETTKLQASYDAAVQRRDEAKKQLAMELAQQQVARWELELQSIKVKEYEKQVGKLGMDIATMQLHQPMLVEGCKQCLPGWTLTNSRCYYFPFADTFSRKSWTEARTYCRMQGGDLAIIDSREKNLAISSLMTAYQNPTRSYYESGFWIGLRDIDEEGVWKWVDGTRLNEGYWNVGEPNNQNNEDCAAVYPKSNPFLSWNDAPCNYNLKWICEMATKAAA